MFSCSKSMIAFLLLSLVLQSFLHHSLQFRNSHYPVGTKYARQEASVIFCDARCFQFDRHALSNAKLVRRVSQGFLYELCLLEYGFLLLEFSPCVCLNTAPSLNQQPYYEECSKPLQENSCPLCPRVLTECKEFGIDEKGLQIRAKRTCGHLPSVSRTIIFEVSWAR
jgi:hypothetical protein